MSMDLLNQLWKQHNNAINTWMRILWFCSVEIRRILNIVKDVFILLTSVSWKKSFDFDQNTQKNGNCARNSNDGNSTKIVFMSISIDSMEYNVINIVFELSKKS